jgi:hypothetical protein
MSIYEAAPAPELLTAPGGGGGGSLYDEAGGSGELGSGLMSGKKSASIQDLKNRCCARCADLKTAFRKLPPRVQYAILAVGGVLLVLSLFVGGEEVEACKCWPPPCIICGAIPERSSFIPTEWTPCFSP